MTARIRVDLAYRYLGAALVRRLVLGPVAAPFFKLEADLEVAFVSGKGVELRWTLGREL